MKYDRRNRLRVKRAGQVVVETADRRTVAGLMRDISMDGLFMTVPDSTWDFLIEGESVRITVILKSGTSVLSIAADAEIGRIDSIGFAILFPRPLKWWPIFVMLPA